MSSFKDLIKQNNALIEHVDVKRLLIIYGMGIFYIGDTCKFFAYLKGIDNLYKDVVIDVNILSHVESVCHVLKGNQRIDNILVQDVEDIDYEQYEVVVAAFGGEEPLMNHLEERYGMSFRGAVFSCSELMAERWKPSFPQDGFLIDYLKAQEGPLNIAPEVYIAAEERQWGSEWLRQNGLEEGEKLIIYLDASSSENKLLPFLVRIELLNYFLKKKDVKVLIFDERKVGKKEYYRRFLKPAAFEKLIIAEELNLRQELCLISSEYVKMVFGPCTGLLHCSSGIYQCLLDIGMPKEDIPIMIVYTCCRHDGDFDDDKWGWWKYSLADCISVDKNENNEVFISRINIDNRTVKYKRDLYSTPLLINYIESVHSDKMIHAGIA